jgi:hypothetical protein
VNVFVEEVSILTLKRACSELIVDQLNRFTSVIGAVPLNRMTSRTFGATEAVDAGTFTAGTDPGTAGTVLEGGAGVVIAYGLATK